MEKRAKEREQTSIYSRIQRLREKGLIESYKQRTDLEEANKC